MEREHLINSYVKNMTTYLTKMSNKSELEIEAFVKHQVELKFKDVLVTNVISDHNQDTKIKKSSLIEFVNKNRSDVITPGGSIYKSATKQTALVKEMIINRLNERSVVKKQMLEAKGNKNDKLAKKLHYQQASIKIGINSLPGGMGSPYNCFYDRSGYNAITSTARSLIAQSYTVCEQLLGSNFAWFSPKEVINHIIINISNRPSDERIENVISKYRLKNITASRLNTFFIKAVKEYQTEIDTTLISNLVDKLSQTEINYLYYMGNLRHVIWDNEQVFKPWIRMLMDISKLDFSKSVDPNALHKVDGDLIAVLTATYSYLLEGVQFKKLFTERKDLACKFVIIAEHFNKHLKSIDELFDTLIYYPTNIPQVNIKKHMWRNTTIASDTDSVLFTSKHWMEWMTGEALTDSPENQQISSLVVYWLTKAVAHVLKKFSIQTGATGDDVYRMKMKNEFKYSSFILFDIKKTYAGVVTIQEGIVLPEPDADIKGANLRSSSIPEYTTKFIKEIIMEDILKASIHKKLSSVYLIKKVVAFENEIRNSVLSGSVEFLKMTSVDNEHTYKAPLSSAYFYYLAWNEIFGKKYSVIRLPTKVSVVPLLKPTNQYRDILNGIDKKITKNVDDFIARYKKFPSFMAINDNVDKIPEELLPIIDTRAIIHNNIRAVYLALAGLGIECGYEKQKLLLSDIYPMN